MKGIYLLFHFASCELLNLTVSSSVCYNEPLKNRMNLFDNKVHFFLQKSPMGMCYSVYYLSNKEFPCYNIVENMIHVKTGWFVGE